MTDKIVTQERPGKFNPHTQQPLTIYIFFQSPPQAQALQISLASAKTEWSSSATVSIFKPSTRSTTLATTLEDGASKNTSVSWLTSQATKTPTSLALEKMGSGFPLTTATIRSLSLLNWSFPTSHT